MLGSAGYQMSTRQGKMQCELGLVEKIGITRIMAEIRLKIVITKGNSGRLNGASIREEFF